MKHQSFDDVSGKANTMDLHEFMTFCKDVEITANEQKKKRKGLRKEN